MLALPRYASSRVILGSGGSAERDGWHRAESAKGIEVERHTLADRIVTYSDTVVAFALVNGLAFLITLGEPDIRCSIANVSSVAFMLNLLFPVFSSYALYWLRNYEYRLRSESCEEAERAETSPREPDELVARFWRIAFVVRLTLIWIFAFIVIIGIYAATQDDRCLAPLG